MPRKPPKPLVNTDFFAKHFAEVRRKLAPFLGRAAPADIRRARALVNALGNIGMANDTMPEDELILCEAIATHVADDRARLAASAAKKAKATKTKSRRKSPPKR